MIACVLGPSRYSLALWVATNPGAIPVTTIPSLPRPRARDWVNELSAPLLAPYARCIGSPRNAPRDGTVTIPPPPRRRLCRTAHQGTLAAPTRVASGVPGPARPHPREASSL